MSLCEGELHLEHQLRIVECLLFIVIKRQFPALSIESKLAKMLVTENDFHVQPWTRVADTILIAISAMLMVLIGPHQVVVLDLVKDGCVRLLSTLLVVELEKVTVRRLRANEIVLSDQPVTPNALLKERSLSQGMLKGLHVLEEKFIAYLDILPVFL